MAMLALGRVNGWAETVGAFADRLLVMFPWCFYSEHTVYPTALNKTVQSDFFCSMLGEVDVPGN